MNAIEIRGLTKNYKENQALKGLDMTVPTGAIYGFIGENGSGKSTTEKLICGLIHPSSGTIKLFGKPHTDADVRAKMGVLIEAPGCFPNYTVWNNMLLQAANLGIKNAGDEVRKVLKLVRMEGAAGNKYKNCSLGMKQRIGIAMALLGNPSLLVLDVNCSTLLGGVCSASDQGNGPRKGPALLQIFPRGGRRGRISSCVRCGDARGDRNLFV